MSILQKTPEESRHALPGMPPLHTPVATPAFICFNWIYWYSIPDRAYIDNINLFMKQVIQDLKTGRVSVCEIPAPVPQEGRVLVRTAASLISAGTERMTVDLGKKSLLGKARERPDLVKQVIQKAKNEGLVNTLNTVRSKLESFTALGYSAAGAVIDTGASNQLRVGDRVSCAGAGYASHAEILSVPVNLCIPVPENVQFEDAAFGTLGAIALQGVRLAELQLGENVVVIGLGLLGQLTVQILKAAGCRVLGLDLDRAKADLALELGADVAAVSSGNNRERVLSWTRGRGADAVLITAATSSNQPVELAGEISRVKGRVVAVGLVGMDIPRKSYYERELTLKISMSYGPGRYDPEYEERGHDYPYAYVRWTEARNIEAFLDLIDQRRVNVQRLISHRFDLSHAEDAYKLITQKGDQSYLGVVLSYPEGFEEKRIKNSAVQNKKAQSTVQVGLIGAGNYAKSMLLPHLKRLGVQFRSVTSASGVTARNVSEKYGFEYMVSGASNVIDDQDVNLVVVATRHNLHAALAIEALAKAKHVFVEKPLALNEEELDEVIEKALVSDAALMVGYNRRFSPLARRAKEFFDNRESPLSILYRVNAGRIPKEHWIQDKREGGGRIIGEVCHFVDLMQYLTNSLPLRVYAESIRARSHQTIDEDSVFITISFEDGSAGTICYLSEGDRSLPKERIEIYAESKSFIIDDFRSATLYQNGKEQKIKLANQDKGQADELRSLCNVVLGKEKAPITLESLKATSLVTFRVIESLKLRKALDLQHLERQARNRS
jgi:predicted dehydrogenase/threonine dehydrogenase-like Zn-dependent dehydrogenase